MEEIKSAGMILFREREQREYLILRYSTVDHYWGFAKGKIENNETPTQAALREVGEETGLKKVKLISDFKEQDSYNFEEDGENYHKECVWFLGEVTSGKVTISHEHEDFKWVNYQEALELLSFKQLKELLTKAENYLVKLSQF